MNGVTHWASRGPSYDWILQQYWRSLLWSDGYRFTGVAVTLWLLIASVVMGGLLAIPMAVARVSSIRWVRFPVWLYTYVFRGTPLYVQLLVFYSGMYSLEIVRGSEFLNAFFRSGLNCTILALTLNTCAYTTEIFAGAIRSVPHGEIEAANAYGFSRFKMYRCIILPSALRTALPAYSNEDPDAALHRAGVYRHRAGSAEDRARHQRRDLSAVLRLRHRGGAVPDHLLRVNQPVPQG